MELLQVNDFRFLHNAIFKNVSIDFELEEMAPIKFKSSDTKGELYRIENNTIILHDFGRYGNDIPVGLMFYALIHAYACIGGLFEPLADMYATIQMQWFFDEIIVPPKYEKESEMYLDRCSVFESNFKSIELMKRFRREKAN